MTTYVFQDVQLLSEQLPFERCDFSDWSLVGTEKKGNDVETTYRLTTSAPGYPTEIRIGVYDKPAAQPSLLSEGRTNFSIRLSGWTKITADDDTVTMAPHSFTVAGSGPYGAVLRTTYSVIALKNLLSWVLPIEDSPVSASWTDSDTKFKDAIGAGITVIDLSSFAAPPPAA